MTVSHLFAKSALPQESFPPLPTRDQRESGMWTRSERAATSNQCSPSEPPSPSGEFRISQIDVESQQLGPTGSYVHKMKGPPKTHIARSRTPGKKGTRLSLSSLLWRLRNVLESFFSRKRG
jgi:hypothetical protein